MIDIYDSIVAGLNEHKPANLSSQSYLQSLQPTLRFLRKSYYSYPVSVPYARQDIQASYLVAYLPHYYQLIYSILNNDKGNLFKNKETVKLGFIGGGPGSEVYGTIKYIINNCQWVKNIHVTIFDINAATWKFSNDIVLKNLIKEGTKTQLPNITWNSIQFDITNEADFTTNLQVFKSLDLLTIQNCVNEIATQRIPVLKSIIVKLFQTLPNSAYLLISDLTSSVRGLMKSIESELESAGGVKFKLSTLNQSGPTSIISVHHFPNKIIRENLMTGGDGLIPRKYLKYDYTLLSREKVEAPVSKATGFMALYSPLEFNKIDANNFVHNKSFIGIDFGTSTTVVSCAVLIKDKLVVKAIPIPQKDKEGHITNDPLVPSVIGLHGNVLMVGKHAFDRKSIMEQGKNIWYGFKENLPYLESIKYEESLLKDYDQLKVSNAKEALVLFFKYLQKEITSYLAKENLAMAAEYSVTVPAAFDYDKKQMIRECLIDAGIPYDDQPFIEEPTAALINYLYESKDPISLNESNKNLLILDIGAGTVDISIMQLEKQVEGIASRLLSVARQGSIGGNLLDELIARKTNRSLEAFDELSTQKKSELLKRCEDLKIKLCKEVETDSTVDYRLPERAFGNLVVRSNEIELQFQEFYKIMEDYWTKIEKTIEIALKKSSLQNEQIHAVILNGGGSRNPYIQNLTRTYFKKSKIVRPDNIQEHVSKGAAMNSFVLNSYGKQIVANIINDPVAIITEPSPIEIIKAGETIPTYEILLIPQNPQFQEDRQLLLSHNGQQVCFLIPKDLFIEKLALLVNLDNELECELITPLFPIKAKRITFNSINNPLMLRV